MPSLVITFACQQSGSRRPRNRSRLITSKLLSGILSVQSRPPLGLYCQGRLIRWMRVDLPTTSFTWRSLFPPRCFAGEKKGTSAQILQKQVTPPKPFIFSTLPCPLSQTLHPRRFRNSPSYLAKHPEVREGYIAEAEVIAKANLDKLQSYPRPAQYIGYCINDVISFMMARFASSPADLMRACIKGGMSQTDPQFRWMIVLNDPFVTILMIISLYTIFPSLCQTRKEMAGAYISWLDRVVYQRIVEARLSLIHLWDAIAARSSLVLHRDKSMQ